MSLLSLLVDPYSKENLKYVSFDNNVNEQIENGILFNTKNNSIYPIINRVPILIKNHIPGNFHLKYKDKIESAIPAEYIKKQILKNNKKFSFSLEWEQFNVDNMEKTWGYTTEERLGQFFEETNTTSSEIKNKIILDAGCGNGLLTKAIAEQGALTIGIDYSDSIFNIAMNNKNPNLLFVKGDLMNPPFKKETFDIIISNGVIHHTKSTVYTFNKVSELVKQGGKFYLWLYRRPFDLYTKAFIRTTDVLRFIVNKLPTFLQKIIVNIYARFFYYYKKIKGKNIMEFDQLRIDAYDTLTPEYKHYHNSIEVAQWFHNNGFEAPVLTHWDNPYGFGMVSTKNPKGQTPGINYKLSKSEATK